MMKSPFPGMDPYLEMHWESVHQRLVTYTCDAIQPRLPNDLWATIQERVFIEADSERMRHIVPDVYLSRVYPAQKPHPDELKEGDTPVAEPVIFELYDLEFTEGYINILDRTAGKVVTVIELLSPANKSGGTGQDKYLEKQGEVLRSDASLVEIDLVRAGQRVLALTRYEIPVQHRSDYLACISRGWKRNRRELYPMPLRQRLPILPIPLRQHEPPVNLDLQVLLDQAYSAGRYDRLDYSIQLDPPLSPDDTAWAETLLKAGGKR